MVGNKVADKITSIGKPKEKGKKTAKEIEEIHISQRKYYYWKKKKLLLTWDCFKHHIKMGYHKIINLLDTTLDEVPRFITKNDRSTWSDR